jgi:L-lysine exporter family protein LysE/ArgO
MPAAMPPAAPGLIALLAKGVLLGLGAAVPIGPVNVQIARQALRRGFIAGFALGCGAVTVDVFYAVLTSVGVQHLPRSAAIEWTVRAGGVGLLTYLGVMCLRGEREAWRADPVTTGLGPATNAGEGPGRAYTTGVFMTLLNPMTLAFWFVAVPALAGPLAARGAAELPVVCAGVFLGTIGWVVVFAGVLALAGRFRRNWWLAGADAAGGTALLVFAAAALLSSIRSLL